MLTPQEVQEKTFVKAVFGGYDMAAVDLFLDQLTADYTSLYKENTVLKSKMKVLVNTVEEYRSVDDQMRKALLSAQKMAEQTKDEAKKEAQRLLSEAHGAVSRQEVELKAEIEAEKKRLAYTKNETIRFISALKELYKGQEALLDSIPGLSFEEAAETAAAAAPQIQKEEPPVQPAEPFKEEIIKSKYFDEALSELPFMEESGQNTQDVKYEQPSEDIKTMEIKLDIPELDESLFEPDPDDTGELSNPKPRFNFSDLQFGSNYSVAGKKKEKG